MQPSIDNIDHSIGVEIITLLSLDSWALRGLSARQ